MRDTNFTLIYFGADPKRPLQLEPAALARNAHDYEDQIAVANAFQHRLIPRALETAFSFLETLSEQERTPIRIEGLQKMLQGYLEGVFGAISCAANPTAKSANARMVAAALRETAEIWIAYSDPEVRKEFVNLLIAAQQQTKDMETAQHFRAIQSALEAAKS